MVFCSLSSRAFQQEFALFLAPKNTLRLRPECRRGSKIKRSQKFQNASLIMPRTSRRKVPSNRRVNYKIMHSSVTCHHITTSSPLFTKWWNAWHFGGSVVARWSSSSNNHGFDLKWDIADFIITGRAMRAYSRVEESRPIILSWYPVLMSLRRPPVTLGGKALMPPRHIHRWRTYQMPPRPY